MSGEINELGCKGVSRAQLKSCRSDESDYSEAIDLLAVWILEDINAVAKSFGVELTGILKDTLDRVQTGAPSFARQSRDTESQGANPGRD